MAVVTYSLKRNGSKSITKNFKVKEFACDGYDTVKIDTNLVKTLQKIRDHFGKSVTVTSGYRPASYNATIASASKTSKHMLGRAADIKIEGVSPIEVAMYAQKIGVKGIGLYVYLEEDGIMNGFTHIDTRSTDAESSIYRGLYTNRKQSQYISCGKKFFPILSKGAKGYHVFLLQRLLNEAGYKVTEDKSFGPKLKDAVMKFQKDMKISVDGSVGNETWTALLKKVKVWP